MLTPEDAKVVSETSRFASSSNIPRNADVSLTTRPAAGVNVRRMKTPHTIGVIGAGTMGAGIAQACVVAGLPVVLIDVDDARVAHGRNAISDGARARGEQGSPRRHLIDKPPSSGCAALRTIEALRDCDFLIEAATENEALKMAILQHIDGVAGDDAIVATNTSSISIGRLAATVKRPHAFVGTHFFNPVAAMNLVEVVRGRKRTMRRSMLRSRLQSSSERHRWW